MIVVPASALNQPAAGAPHPIMVALHVFNTLSSVHAFTHDGDLGFDSRALDTNELALYNQSLLTLRLYVAGEHGFPSE